MRVEALATLASSLLLVSMNAINLLHHLHEVKSALYYSLKASNIFKTFEFERSAKTNGILGQYRESTPFPEI